MGSRDHEVKFVLVDQAEGHIKPLTTGHEHLEWNALERLSSLPSSALLKLNGVENLLLSIPNGVDAERFKPELIAEKRCLRGELKLQDKFTVLFVGEIVPRKRPHLILEAISHCNLQ